MRIGRPWTSGRRQVARHSCPFKGAQLQKAGLPRGRPGGRRRQRGQRATRQEKDREQASHRFRDATSRLARTIAWRASSASSRACVICSRSAALQSSATASRFSPRAGRPPGVDTAMLPSPPDLAARPGAVSPAARRNPVRSCGRRPTAGWEASPSAARRVRRASRERPPAKGGEGCVFFCVLHAPLHEGDERRTAEPVGMRDHMGMQLGVGRLVLRHALPHEAHLPREALTDGGVVMVEPRGAGLAQQPLVRDVPVDQCGELLGGRRTAPGRLQGRGEASGVGGRHFQRRPSWNDAPVSGRIGVQAGVCRGLGACGCGIGMSRARRRSMSARPPI